MGIFYVVNSIVFVNMSILKSLIIMVRQFVGIFITMFSKMEMKKFVFICNGLKIAITHKACCVFSLKKK
jgi:hypothetical protein